MFAEHESEIIAVSEWGFYDENPVVWKLYVHPEHRSKGVGPQLQRNIIDDLPSGTAALQVEHFTANKRAGAFYEREGFRELRKVEDDTNPSVSVIWRELTLQEKQG